MGVENVDRRGFSVQNNSLMKLLRGELIKELNSGLDGLAIPFGSERFERYSKLNCVCWRLIDFRQQLGIGGLSLFMISRKVVSLFKARFLTAN